MRIKEKLRVSYERDRVIRINGSYEGVVSNLDSDVVSLQETDGSSKLITIGEIESVEFVDEEIDAEKDKQIAELQAEIAELKRLVSEPVEAEPHDMAKERWEYDPEYGVANTSDEREDLYIFTIAWGTDAQMELATAAPELADRMREFVNGEDDMDHKEVCAKLLRGLGIPNVAPRE